MQNQELQRTLNGFVNHGIVRYVDYENALCRVQIEELVTDWLPFTSVRMGAVKVWNPPCEGEQVAVISETGELDTAFVTGSFDYYKQPQPSNNPHTLEVHCKDGAVFSYNHDSHDLRIDLPDESKTTLVTNELQVSADDVLFECDNYAINCQTYSLVSNENKQDGQFVINGKPYLLHGHFGVQTGTGVTGGVSG